MTSQANALERAIRASYGALVTDLASRELIDRSRLAVAVVDASGRVVGASDGAPVANLEAIARRCLDGPRRLRVGEAAITNDPYSGGTRVQDHFVVAPAHAADDGIVGGAVVCTPFVDVGGLTLGNNVPNATDIWVEGVRTTPVRVRRGGRTDEDVLRLLTLNSRVPALISADVAVLCDIAERLAAEVAPLLADGTAEAVLADERTALVELLRSGEGRRAQAVRHLAGEKDDGQLRVELQLAVSDGALVVDLAGSSPQVDGRHLNATRHTTVTAVAEAVRAAAGCAPSSAITDLIEVRCPDQSIVNCDFPRPVGGSVETTCKAVADAMSECLKNVLAGSAAN